MRGVNGIGGRRNGLMGMSGNVERKVRMKKGIADDWWSGYYKCSERMCFVGIER